MSLVQCLWWQWCWYWQWQLWGSSCSLFIFSNDEKYKLTFSVSASWSPVQWSTSSWPALAISNPILTSTSESLSTDDNSCTWKVFYHIGFQGEASHIPTAHVELENHHRHQYHQLSSILLRPPVHLSISLLLRSPKSNITTLYRHNSLFAPNLFKQWIVPAVEAM